MITKTGFAFPVVMLDFPCTTETGIKNPGERWYAGCFQMTRGPGLIPNHPQHTPNFRVPRSMEVRFGVLPTIHLRLGKQMILVIGFATWGKMSTPERKVV